MSGGGTTLVEALASGRHAIGVDISTLAEFVATVKTRVFSDAELDRLDAWSKRVADSIGISKPGLHFECYAENTATGEQIKWPATTAQKLAAARARAAKA